MRDLATESLWFLSNTTQSSLSPIPPSASCNSCEMNNWCQAAPVIPAVLLRAQTNINTTPDGYLKHNQDLKWGLSPSQSGNCIYDFQVFKISSISTLWWICTSGSLSFSGKILTTFSLKSCQILHNKCSRFLGLFFFFLRDLGNNMREAYVL